VPDPMPSLVRSRATFAGVAAGFVYGLVARLVATFSQPAEVFGVMSIAFLWIVPVVIGFLAVRPVAHPSWAYRVFAPWVPALLMIGAVIVIGWEGAICAIMALPLILPLASIGGVIGGSAIGRRPEALPAVVLLPYLFAPLERRIAARDRMVVTSTQIVIAAPPSVVWPLVASVDSIAPAEHHRALFTTLGLPRPVSATLSRRGVGGIRRARFERGLVFTETVTDWQPGVRLSFTIDPNTDEIPPTTLDAHVTIGGPFFDVLTGTYELYPLDGGRATRLVLRSEHRVTTRFNLYAKLWTDRVMRSIQENILEVQKARAEKSPATS
jgi:polyketide cyclase/dehydrase/lipid transport protein